MHRIWFMLPSADMHWFPDNFPFPYASDVELTHILFGPFVSFVTRLLIPPVISYPPKIEQSPHPPSESEAPYQLNIFEDLCSRSRCE